MKITLKVPIVKQAASTSWERYQVDGSLEVEAGDKDYPELCKLSNILLDQLSAEYKLIEDSGKVVEQIDRAKRCLSDVNSELRVARNQLERLTRFLGGMGIDARSAGLNFDEHLKLRSAEHNDDTDYSDPISY